MNDAANSKTSAAHKKSNQRLPLLLFLSLWFIYGALINSGNLTIFGLQQVGVEAFERHHFYLEGSHVPELHVEPVNDAFLFNGHIYPAKQPGQFMAGALAYFPLRALGVKYSRNYALTAALVTFLSASLVLAASVVAVFKTTFDLSPATRSTNWALVTSLTFGLATTAFAYSGIAWHDTLATGYLAVAFYLMVHLRQTQTANRREVLIAAFAGMLLGMTITTSLLPVFMVIISGVYFVSFRRWKLIAAVVAGGLIGLAPLLFHNYVSFGNPLLVPNIAGNYSDTFFKLDWRNFTGKILFYSKMVSLYVPVFWAGLVGFAFYPRRLRREQMVMIAMVVTLCLYIFNIQTTGTCQYGPRYLLPAMPIVSLGLIGFSWIERKALRQTAVLLSSILAVISFLINLIGTMHGAMLCDFPHFAPALYLSQMWHGEMRSYPLAYWLLVPTLICVGWFALEVNKQLRAELR